MSAVFFHNKRFIFIFGLRKKDLRFDLRFVVWRFEIWSSWGIWDLAQRFKSFT